MRRLFWVAVGATAGVAAVRKAQKTARAFTPTGLAERAGGIGASLRSFPGEVRAGMAEREAELRRSLGIDEAAADRAPIAQPETPAHPRRSAG